MRGHAKVLAVMLAGLGGLSQARADRPQMSSRGEPCTDWCGYVQAWESPGMGTGPETGMTTILELGAVSETLRAGAAERQETAALVGFEFRFMLTTRESKAADRAGRVRVLGQHLGWRAGDRMDAPASDAGGSVTLGYTESLVWLSRFSKLSATFDAEGATGLGLGPRLGLHTADVSSRAVGAAGLALGLRSRLGGLRAHARVLRALTADPAWETAVDVGAGVATRFDWPGFGGPSPVEVWIDARERRGIGGEARARERELTTGINYVRKDGFARIGLAAIVTEQQRADGTTAVGRAVMFQFDRPFGDQ
jgi:hypothetical protein